MFYIWVVWDYSPLTLGKGLRWLIKVAIYARVSTGFQVTEGSGLEVQIDLCQKKSKELGITAEGDVEIFREEGVSGEDIDRPALNVFGQRLQRVPFHMLL